MNTETMTISEFAAHTSRTWHDQGKEKNLFHSFLGLHDEAGELASNLKKHIGYGREIDLNNILEEGGDFMYFLVRAWVEMEDIERLKISFKTIRANHRGLIKCLNQMTQAYANAEFYALIFDDEDQAVTELVQAASSRAAYLDQFGFTIEQAMIANVAKLQERYPEKWNVADATNRDREAERTAIDNHIQNAN